MLESGAPIAPPSMLLHPVEASTPRAPRLQRAAVGCFDALDRSMLESGAPIASPSMLWTVEAPRPAPVASCTLSKQRAEKPPSICGLHPAPLESCIITNYYQYRVKRPQMPL